MIRSFKHKGLKLLYTKDDRSKIEQALVSKVIQRLTVLDNAKVLDDINLPAYRLHSLHGNPKRYSIWVNGNFRMTFSFDTEPYDVDLEDYH
jgi:proteic killer suppression protein